MPRPSRSDRIADTVDYWKVSEIVVALGTKSTFRLLEALAGAIGAKIQELYPRAQVADRAREARAPLPRRPGSVRRAARAAARWPVRERSATRSPVRFADIDHAGIVYYPRFFHFFHVAFEELWRARIGPRAYAELIDRDRVGFPAVRAECDFMAPLRFGDTAEIEVAVARLGGKSITFRYRIYRADAEPRARCAPRGQVVCAVVDLARFVAIAVPERVIAMLEDLVEREG